MSDYIGLPDSYDRWLTTEPEYDEPTIGAMIYEQIDDNDPQFNDEKGTFNVYLCDSDIIRNLFDKEGKFTEWEDMTYPEGNDLYYFNFYAEIYRTEDGHSARLIVSVNAEDTATYDEVAKQLEKDCGIKNDGVVLLEPDEVEGIIEGVTHFVQESKELCDEFNIMFGTKLVSLEEQEEEYAQPVPSDKEMQDMADKEFESRVNALKSDIAQTLRDCELVGNNLYHEDDFLTCGRKLSLEQIIGDGKTETKMVTGFKYTLDPQVVSDAVKTYGEAENGSIMQKKIETLLNNCGYTQLVDQMQKAQTISKTDVPVEKTDIKKGQVQE